MHIKYVHTNLIARDWKKLADFYVQVFGCTYKEPARDLKESWLDRLTGFTNTHIQGIHLHLPGYTEGEGPSLESFQYHQQIPGNKEINVEGFAHLAFAVEDPASCLARIETHGGSSLGEFVSGTIAGVGEISVVYARDPEGNIRELQQWAASSAPK